MEKLLGFFRSRCAIFEALQPQNQTLHFYAYIGSKGGCIKLLRGGADVNTKDANGYTPLQIAAATGNYQMCVFLIFYGRAKVKNKVFYHVYDDYLRSLLEDHGGIVFPFRQHAAHDLSQS